MRGIYIVFGLIFLFLGIGLLCYYNIERNRIYDKYFEKGYEAGASGNYGEVPELVDEETEERNAILPCCYGGIGFISLGVILVLVGLVAKDENQTRRWKPPLDQCPYCGERLVYIEDINIGTSRKPMTMKKYGCKKCVKAFFR